MKTNDFPKYIVVTGGVISGVGKGIATASIGKILQQYGFSVTAVKIDPYINFDAGTLRPTEHGEVWVTDDGGEIDQDLGNYERFLEERLSRKHNITTGQIYSQVIDNERRGKYLGQTVQFIPHIPDEIKRRIKEISKDKDFVLIEVGGTIGDYENIPYLFALKGLERELGHNRVKYVMITYLPTPSHIGEMKTKPTQQAIKLLSEHGIFPDFILCRAPMPLDKIRKKKIETYANIHSDHVISAPDAGNLYTIPLNFEKDNLGMKILKEFGLEPRRRKSWSKWRNLVNIIEHPKRTVDIAMVGKYLDIGKFSLTDSYISVNQAVEHAAANNDIGINIHWISAQDIEKKRVSAKEMKKYRGFIVPGGFGSEGVEGKISIIRYARENRVPYLGLCFGMQLAVVEYARNVCSMKNANSTEINPKTGYPVICVLESQREVLRNSRYGASMRLGAYGAVLKKDSLIYSLYRETGRMKKDKGIIEEYSKGGDAFRLGICDNYTDMVLERHRHRYEMNPQFIEELCDSGLVFSGHHDLTKNEQLMEFIELPGHPYFAATQAHPEFKSSLFDPAPLFWGFIRAVKNLD